MGFRLETTGPISKPVVLVTGVSTGVGLALARKLWAMEDYNVVVTARTPSLERLSKEPFKNTDRFWIRPLDVNSDSERRALIEEVTRRWGAVDFLINNAGISYRAVFEHMSDDDLKNQFATNFLSPMALVRLVLPGMRAKRCGHIINVSSVGGMMAMPTMAAYSASKFALEGASEALWYEVRPWNISVTLVQPGFIHSESFKNVYYSLQSKVSRDDPTDDYHAYYETMAPFIAKMMGRSLSTAENIADVVLKTMRRDDPPLRVPATLDAWFFGVLRRILPRGIYHGLLYFFLPVHRKLKR